MHLYDKSDVEIKKKCIYCSTFLLKKSVVMYIICSFFISSSISGEMQYLFWHRLDGTNGILPDFNQGISKTKVSIVKKVSLRRDFTSLNEGL